MGPALDELSDAVSLLRVEGETHQTTTTGSSIAHTTSIGLGGAAKRDGPELSAEFGGSSESGSTREDTINREGPQTHHIHIGTLGKALSKLTDLLGQCQIWLLLDEWSAIPQDLQPYLADLLKRAVLPINSITVKIAAIEHRSVFQCTIASGNYTGMESGADIQANINLDDFMVFDNDKERAKDFFKELLYRHIRTVDGFERHAELKSPDQLLNTAFTQITSFEEFVKALGGVPRDAINIIEAAAQRALNDKIGVPHIRQAARDWY
jgi:hypothetical protein